MFANQCRNSLRRVVFGLCYAAVTLAGSGIADAAAAATLQTQPMDPSMRTLRGELVMIRPREIILKGNEGPDRVIKIATATMVTRDGKAATIKDLKDGDQVEVLLGEKDVARSIKVTAEKK